MRIQIVSDVHHEFHRDGGRSLIKSCKTDADVLVVAGDLDTHQTLGSSLSLLCAEYKHVVYTTGNHEYYNSSFEEVAEICEKAKARNPNLHILDGSMTTIDGHRFLGGTLWFRDTPTNQLFQNNMNDFRIIKEFENWVYKENDRVVKFLEESVVFGDIVVTHHLPSEQCVDPDYKGSNLNKFFVCDMDKVILDNKPKLWFFGHTHSSLDTVLGETRMVCNPFGYAGYDENRKFKDKLVIEV